METTCPILDRLPLGPVPLATSRAVHEGTQFIIVIIIVV